MPIEEITQSPNSIFIIQALYKRVFPETCKLLELLQATHVEEIAQPISCLAWLPDYIERSQLVSRSIFYGEVELKPKPSLADLLKFQRLAAEWKRERGATSSITQMSICDSYQEIIGMGPTVVPLILAQLKAEGTEPDQWFWALQVLTGADPVNPQDRGDFEKMSKSWIDWAATMGYAG